MYLSNRDSPRAGKIAIDRDREKRLLEHNDSEHQHTDTHRHRAKDRKSNRLHRDIPLPNGAVKPKRKPVLGSQGRPVARPWLNPGRGVGRGV